LAVRQPIRSEVQPYFEVYEASYFAARTFYANAGKRAFDIVLSLVLLVALAPVLLLLAAAVAVTSGFPVFYGGERVGKDGRPFRMWKLRTMVPNAEAIIEEWKRKGTEEGLIYFQSYKLRKDPRITPLGRFLRKTSLDELPQLWNVLRGDMSFVGPRPIVEGELEKYGEDADAFLSVRPGVTGLWQVSGRNQIDYPERAYLELDYVRRLSLRQDAAVLLRTVPVLLKRNGY
jgi:lipopolysaccharide/colanic/teichoic acid biosynthesis glycosyltransferase